MNTTLKLLVLAPFVAAAIACGGGNDNTMPQVPSTDMDAAVPTADTSSMMDAAPAVPTADTSSMMDAAPAVPTADTSAVDAAAATDMADAAVDAGKKGGKGKGKGGKKGT